MFKENFFSTTGSAEDMQNFITAHTDLLPDENDWYMYWCDEEHSLGINLSNSGGYIVIYCGNGEKYTVSNKTFTSSSGYYTYAQQSKKGTVAYLAQHRSSSADSYGQSPNLIVAQDQGGDWAIIIGGTLYYKNGTVNIGSVGVTPDYNAPFSATKVYNTATGAAFPELYKINSATTFTLRGTYVNFGGQGYRCVDGRIAKLADALPCYAFPVADV